MSFIKDYLDNVVSGTLNPKGNLGDYSHAANLFVNSQHRLSPKTKYLYQCVFELSNAGRNFATAFNSNPELLSEFGILVKNVDLPKVNMETVVKNQYNRKKNVQTHLSYDPVNITFHDDSFGVTTALLEGYYRYYFADGNYTTTGATASYDPRNLYKGGENTNTFRYGLDNESTDPFFDKITIYQMDRHQWTSFTLVNPLITTIQHDTMDYYDATTPVQNQITVAYESIFYDRGSVDADPPPGIGGPKYDNTPSPLTSVGGGTSTLLGQGGVAEGLSGIFGDVAAGQVGLDTIIQGINTYENAKDLNRSGLRQEGMNILANASGAAVGRGIVGIANTVFPKGTGRGNITANGIPQTGINLAEEINPNVNIVDPANAQPTVSANRASGGQSDVNSPIYEERIRAAESNNDRTGGGG